MSIKQYSRDFPSKEVLDKAVDTVADIYGKPNKTFREVLCDELMDMVRAPHSAKRTIFGEYFDDLAPVLMSVDAEVGETYWEEGDDKPTYEITDYNYAREIFGILIKHCLGIKQGAQTIQTQSPVSEPKLMESIEVYRNIDTINNYNPADLDIPTKFTSVESPVNTYLGGGGSGGDDR